MKCRLPASLFAVALALGSIDLFAAEDARDFSGVWQAFASTATDESAAKLTPDGEIRIADFSARYPNPVEPEAYCVRSGMPGMMTSVDGNALEILQSNDRITLIGADGEVRRIFLDGRTAPAAHQATRMGYSVGNWESDTLVITTTLLDEMLSGRWPRTESASIVERVTKTRRDFVSATAAALISSTPLDDTVLAVQLTLTDSTLYNEPQSITVYYQHLDEASLSESDCEMNLWLQALDAANE